MKEDEGAHIYSLGDCDGIRTLCDEARGLKGEQDNRVLNGNEHSSTDLR